MDSPEIAQLIAKTEQLSPERYPDQAIALNQRIVQLDPHHAAAYVRLARGYQAQRNFAAAIAACQDALHHHPQSSVARLRLQRITEEWELVQHVQAIATYDEAYRRGVDNKDQKRVGEAIACLWRAIDLSTTPSQAIRAQNALAAAYRSKKDPGSLDRAAAQYEWVLRQTPGNLTARRGLAAVLYEQRKMNRGQWEQTWRRKDTKARAERDWREPEDERDRRRTPQWEHQKHRQQRQKAAQQQESAHQRPKKPRTLAEALNILNLRLPTTRAEIRRAYRAQAQLAHPDHGGSHAAMVRLNAAYELAREAVPQEGRLQGSTTARSRL
jgi:tetratricopeptide (TPR) repeat protein